MRISIFGLGYVGAVTGACLAKLGHEVVGVDPDEQKLRFIREGKSPILEEGLDELMGQVVGAGRFRGSSDCDEAIAATDLSLVCVGTPSMPNGGLKTEYVERVAEQIGGAIRGKGTYHSVVIRSTVLPGTTEGVVVPILREAVGGEPGEAFGISMHPEFLREGTSLKDFFDPPFTVIGTADEAEFERICGIYRPAEGAAEAGVEAVGGERLRCAVSTAEAIKYGCNIFHAVKITFANEMGMFCKRTGVDAREVMAVLCEDRKLNISAKYMKPGFAFGGSCLPKDLRAYLDRGKKQDVDLPMLDAILPSNRHQVERVAERVKAYGSRKVSMMGISFKEATDDLRESPLVRLAELLIGQGYDLRIYDPNVRYASLYGSNKAFIDRELPHLKSVLVDADGAVGHAEVVVFGHDAPPYREVVAKLRPGQKVLDLVGVAADGCPADVEGLYW